MNAFSWIHRNLSGYIFEPGFWFFKRLPVLHHYKLFRRQQWDSVEDFYARQKKMLVDLLLHSISNIPRYQSLSSAFLRKEIEEDSLKALQHLPIQEKAEITSAPDKFYTELGRGTFKNSTGGSTGAPVSFLQDNIYQSATLGATYLFFEWAGCPPGAPRVKLWGAQRDITHGGHGLKFRLGNFLGNRKILNCFMMTPVLIAEYVGMINSFKPWVIEGYVDALYELCKFAQNQGLKVDHRPCGIVTSAGTLFPHMRTMIEETLNAPVFDRYGSREAGNMAAECAEHNGLHIMGETTIIEVVDENGSPLPPEEEGDILVTNLRNYTMPLIRYRIGDRGALSAKKCNCGRPYPILKYVSGRSSSSFLRKDGGVVSPAFFIHFIGVVHNDGKIRKFQIVQKDFERVLIRLVPREGFNLAQWDNKEALIQNIKKAMGPTCQVEFSIEDDIEKTPTGKHLYTVSELH